MGRWTAPAGSDPEGMIRLATPPDATGIASVITAAQASWSTWAGDAFEPYNLSRLTKVWQSRLVDPGVFTAVWDSAGTVCAVVSFNSELDSFAPSNLASSSAHLSTLFCLPDHQGTGVALSLHDEAVAAMRERGYLSTRLWVPSSAAQARRFYLKNLWTDTGRTVLFAGLDRTEMRREL